MDNALILDRLQFAFTITFHYIFPQFTMGLALLIVILKTMALRTENPHYDQCARFWAKIFAINFADRRRDRHSDGVSVRHQLGAILTLRGRRHWPDSRDGRHVCFFLEITFLGLFLLRRKDA